MALVYRQPQRVADWVAAQIGGHAPSVDAAIGYEIEGTLMAGVYFDGYCQSNIFAHIAAKTAMLPQSLMVAVAKYVYGQLGLPRMTFTADCGDARLLSFLRGMGAEHEATLKQGSDGRDTYLFVLWDTSEFPRRLLNRGARHGIEESPAA